MKRCNRCNREFPDNLQFCSSCGGKLVPVSQPHNNQVPMAMQGNMNRSNMNQANAWNGQNNSSSKKGIGVLIAIIAVLAVVLIGVVGYVILNGNEPDDVEVSNSSVVEDDDKSGDSDDSLEAEEDKKDETASGQDLSEFEDYYDSIDDVFGKLIVTDTSSGKISTYKDSLKDALKSKNFDNAKYNYDKLKGLETSLKKSSKTKIGNLKNTLKKLEKKSYAKSAKKGTEYKKNKSLAEDELSSGNYKKAKTYYEACIDRLKKAKAKKKKSSSSSNSSSNSNSSSRSSSTNDSWYKVNTYDNTTYNEVYYNYLDPSYVAGMSGEQKRYYMNTLFAAYGYRFNNSTIQNYFNNQSWYSPDYSISPGNQTAIRNKFDAMCSYNYDLLK